MRQDPRFPHLHIVDHPLVQHKLSFMRDKNTTTRDFRDLLREIALLMGYEITRDLELTYREIETPLCKYSAPFLANKKPVVVPVLRVGHIGMYRDENKRPVEYLVKLPPHLQDRRFFVVDPMLATGYSAAHAVDVLKKRGVKAEQIAFMALVCAPEGVQTFQELHPDIEVYTASLDDHLNEAAYIVPGLGDAGDRIFGTK